MSQQSGVFDLICLVAEACNALSGFQPTLTGGDGAKIPFCEYLDISALPRYDLWICAYRRLSSFCRLLATAEICDRLSPRDRPNSIVSPAAIREIEELTVHRFWALTTQFVGPQ